MRKPAPARPARPDPKLVAALGQPSYTPAVRDLPAVIALLDDADATLPRKAAAALARTDRAVALAALAAAPATVGTVRARGQLGRDDAATTSALVALVADRTEPRRRREAAIALGKVGGATATAALLAVLDEADADPALRRSVVEALGKLGGEQALTRLRALDAGADGELARRQARAALMIERDGARAEASTVRLDAPLPPGQSLLAHCRDGLAPLLVEELTELGLAATTHRPGAVRVQGAPTLGAVLRARLLLAVGLPLPVAPNPDAAALAAALAAKAALLVGLTDGPVRWRLDVVGEGHRRGLVWGCASEVRRRAPALVNDPTTTTWDVVWDPARGELDARPRRFVDERFAWRQRDVPAASHPTIAAALARLGGVEPGDVVWDPFCGSGAELIERAQRGPAARLVGTDLSEAALAAARANVAAAGLTERVALALGDARRSAPAGVTLVISNPPLGRRIRGDVHTMLLEFVRHAATALAPGGRLVWVTPIARDSDALLRSLGLRLERDLPVDLGGFDVPMQRWRKPA
jgi:predicted RNA methylase